MMSTNRELRAEAWRIVRGKWFWRLLIVCVVLQAISQGVSGIVAKLFTEFQIQTWGGFLESKLRAAQAGYGYDVPSMAVAWRMTGAGLFQSFIAYVFAAICAFGLAGATLKATRDDGDRWLAESLTGFKRPLEVAGLLFLINFKCFLWSLLFVIPGLVAAYRYRLSWFLKSEHPEWSARQCIAESCRMMDGYKWKAFLFDMSYFGWMLLGGVAMGLVAALGAFSSGSVVVGIIAAAFGVGAIYLLLFIIIYFLTGRTVFYNHLRDSV